MQDTLFPGNRFRAQKNTFRKRWLSIRIPLDIALSMFSIAQTLKRYNRKTVSLSDYAVPISFHFVPVGIYQDDVFRFDTALVTENRHPLR